MTIPLGQASQKVTLDIPKIAPLLPLGLLFPAVGIVPFLPGGIGGTDLARSRDGTPSANLAAGHAKQTLRPLAFLSTILDTRKNSTNNLPFPGKRKEVFSLLPPKSSMRNIGALFPLLCTNAAAFSIAFSFPMQPTRF